MTSKATLVDTKAIPRLVITRLSGSRIANHFIPGEVQILGAQYQIHAKAALTPHEIAATSLTELLNDFHRTTTFSIWGFQSIKFQAHY